MFFTNRTWLVGPPTLDPSLYTYTSPYATDIFATNPWRAPGTAAVYSPCGVLGGNPRGCDGVPPTAGAQCDGGGYALGVDASTQRSGGMTTSWQRGTSVEASWGIIIGA